MEHTATLCAGVTEGTIAAHNGGMQLYRRVLLEAWRSDLELDPSEISLLWVLRRELGIRHTEHFLVEHHTDFHNYWNAEQGFLVAMTGLRGRGLVYVLEGRLVLPEDLVSLVRQVLGLEMTTDARRRFLTRLSGQELSNALQLVGLRATGSKEEKLQRLLDNYIPPSELLASMAIGELREICRDLSLNVSGSKDELVFRIVKHHATDRDIAAPEPEAPAPEPEPRQLTTAAFDALFASLRQQDLSDILAGIGSSRVTGAKDHLVRLVRESGFSESTLLMELDMKQLEAALDRQRLRTSGAKRDRAQRLLEWARVVRGECSRRGQRSGDHDERG